MESYLNIKVNSNIYLKDPESSDLGKRIITGSIDLMNEIGFEGFTFKRLANKINSTEASVYRYFESKHKVLLYLISWYWTWTDFRLFIALSNVRSPREKLMKAIHLLTSSVEIDDEVTFINEVKLQQIVVSESSKTYMTKDVDAENEEGVFLVYKKLVQRVCDVIAEIQPNYQYPHMLVSTIIEGSHQQRFFAQHLPKLTDTKKGEDSVTCFYTNMALSCLDMD